MRLLPRLSFAPRLLVLALVVGLLIGMALGSYLAADAPPKEYLQAVVTLFATFLGGYFAFSLQQSRDEETRRREHIRAGNGRCLRWFG